MIVESEHESKKKGLLQNLLGRNIDLEELLIAGLIFLLLFQKRGQEKAPSPLKLDGIQDILGKIADNDILILMLIYLLL